jgi:hypothetical protein
MIDNIFMIKKSRTLQNRHHRTISYNDLAASWSGNNHLLGTKLLSASDDSNNNLPWNPGRARTEIMVKESHLTTGTFL